MQYMLFLCVSWCNKSQAPMLGQKSCKRLCSKFKPNSAPHFRSQIVCHICIYPCPLYDNIWLSVCVVVLSNSIARFSTAGFCWIICADVLPGVLERECLACVCVCVVAPVMNAIQNTISACCVLGTQGGTGDVIQFARRLYAITRIGKF